MPVQNDNVSGGCSRDCHLYMLLCCRCPCAAYQYSATVNARVSNELRAEPQVQPLLLLFRCYCSASGGLCYGRAHPEGRHKLLMLFRCPLRVSAADEARDRSDGQSCLLVRAPQAVHQPNCLPPGIDSGKTALTNGQRPVSQDRVGNCCVMMSGLRSTRRPATQQHYQVVSGVRKAETDAEAHLKYDPHSAVKTACGRGTAGLDALLACHRDGEFRGRRGASTIARAVSVLDSAPPEPPDAPSIDAASSVAVRKARPARLHKMAPVFRAARAAMLLTT